MSKLQLEKKNVKLGFRDLKVKVVLIDISLKSLFKLLLWNIESVRGSLIAEKFQENIKTFCQVRLQIFVRFLEYLEQIPIKIVARKFYEFFHDFSSISLDLLKKFCKLSCKSEHKLEHWLRNENPLQFSCLLECWKIFICNKYFQVYNHEANNVFSYKQTWNKSQIKKNAWRSKKIVLFLFHFRDFIIQLMQQISWTNHTVKSTMELFLELHLIERRSSCKTCRLFEWHSWY